MQQQIRHSYTLYLFWHIGIMTLHCSMFINVQTNTQIGYRSLSKKFPNKNCYIVKKKVQIPNSWHLTQAMISTLNSFIQLFNEHFQHLCAECCPKEENNKTATLKKTPQTCSNIFTDMSPTARDIKERINKWDLVKIKSFCTAKENIKMKREPTIWENIFTNDISDKG